MDTITLYLWGADGVYAGAAQADPMGPMPSRSTPTAPPDVPVGMVARWVGQWIVSEPPVPVAVTPPVPVSVSRAQGKAALALAGHWAAVIAYVEAIEDPTTRLLAEFALDDTSEWRRDSPFLGQVADALGWTSQQVDTLFITASEIVL